MGAAPYRKGKVLHSAPATAVDGTQTFTDECGRDAPVIWAIAAARCSRRLEIQKLAGDLVVFDRFAASKSAGTKVSLKYRAFSDHP